NESNAIPTFGRHPKLTRVVGVFEQKHRPRTTQPAGRAPDHCPAEGGAAAMADPHMAEPGRREDIAAGPGNTTREPARDDRAECNAVHDVRPLVAHDPDEPGDFLRHGEAAPAVS